MLNNRIRVRIEFDFKGKTHKPVADIDLDTLMLKYDGVPSLHELVAEICHIDPYSYEFDVLLSEELIFEEVQGFAAEYIDDGRFDTEQFADRWHREHALLQIARIAAEHLGIESLDEHPALKAALLEAWHIGQAAAPRHKPDTGF